MFATSLSTILTKLNVVRDVQSPGHMNIYSLYHVSNFFFMLNVAPTPLQCPYICQPCLPQWSPTCDIHCGKKKHLLLPIEFSISFIMDDTYKLSFCLITTESSVRDQTSLSPNETPRFSCLKKECDLLHAFLSVLPNIGFIITSCLHYTTITRAPFIDNILTTNREGFYNMWYGYCEVSLVQCHIVAWSRQP